jgi:hypothetical protein
MANRYWVGGTGTWDNTANWSTTSGGTGGASIPTSSDSVIFDRTSDVTIYSATNYVNCLDFTVSSSAVANFATVAPTRFTVNGNLTLLSTTTFSGTIFFLSTTAKTITTNGASLAVSFDFSGTGGSWTPTGEITTTGGLNITSGTFNTTASNYSLTLGSLGGSGGSITLNASTVTLTDYDALYMGTGVTLNAGTSTINCTALGPLYIFGGGKTYKNVNFYNSAYLYDGPNTFDVLTLGSGADLYCFANQTIGTLIASGASNSNRTAIFGQQASGYTDGRRGGVRTLTVGTWTTKQYIDFRDITAAGTSAPWSGTSLGDCQGNSNITFPAAKTVYWRYGSAGNLYDPGWSLTSTGTIDTSLFPLAHDTIIIDNNTTTQLTLSYGYNIKTVDSSARTTAYTLYVAGINYYGNWNTGSGITYTGANSITFSGNTPQTFSSNGKQIPLNLNAQSTSTVTLLDALTCSSSLTISSGTFNANNFPVTISKFYPNNGGPALTTATMGTGTWTITGSGVAFSPSNASNLTLTANCNVILTSASAKTFQGKAKDYTGITLVQGGAGALTIDGGNTFTNIDNNYKSSGPTTITLTSGTTTTVFSNFTASGLSGGFLTLNSSTAGTPATLSKTSGTINATYMNIKDSTVTGGATWNATSSINGGNNTGWNISSNFNNFSVFFD